MPSEMNLSVRNQRTFIPFQSHISVRSLQQSLNCLTFALRQHNHQN